MDWRHIALTGAGLVIGAGIGWFAKPAPELEDRPKPDAVSPQVAQATRKAPDLASATSDDCAELDKAHQMLKLQLRLTENQLQAISREYLGDPVQWPDEVAPLTAPDEFQDQLAKAIEACDVNVDVVGMDCNEPPCLAMLRGGEDGWYGDLVNDCPEWFEPFGTSVTSANGLVECPDGSTQSYKLLGVPSSVVLGEPTDNTDKENRTKRFHARIDEAKRAWRCD